MFLNVSGRILKKMMAFTTYSAQGKVVAEFLRNYRLFKKTSAPPTGTNNNEDISM